MSWMEIDKGFEREIHRIFDSHEASAVVHVLPLSQELMDSPDTAIDKIVRIYNTSLDDAYTDEKGVNNRSFVEAVAGGPMETIPWAVYNSVGAAYPYLDREKRDRALGKIISILDLRNYAEVNGGRGYGHTPGIREPLLLSDITIARSFYWPGLHDEDHKWKKYTSFSELQKEMMDKTGMFKPEAVNSDFLVAYAFLRSDTCSWGEDYAKEANPNFLERVLKGIVALRFGRKLLDEQEIDKGRKRLMELLPKRVHGRIEPLRIEADWVDYRKFP
jgi:hypothetical protein